MTGGFSRSASTTHLASPGYSKSSPSTAHSRDMLLLQERAPLLSLPGGPPTPAGAVPAAAGGQQQGSRPGKLVSSGGGGAPAAGARLVAAAAAGGGGAAGEGTGKLGAGGRGDLRVCTGSGERGAVPRGTTVCLAALQLHGNMEEEEEEEVRPGNGWVDVMVAHIPVDAATTNLAEGQVLTKIHVLTLIYNKGYQRLRGLLSFLRRGFGWIMTHLVPGSGVKEVNTTESVDEECWVPLHPVCKGLMPIKFVLQCPPLVWHLSSVTGNEHFRCSRAGFW